jgi:hypothetical protein
MRIITTIVVAATAVAGLTACNVQTSSNATADGKAAHHHSVSIKAGSKPSSKQTSKPTSKPAPSFTTAQNAAMQSARSYLDMGTGFSRAGLISQLTSKYGESFKMADAVFAVNHIQPDWNQQAAESAKGYMKMGGYSRAGLISQLTSKYGEGFTPAQATYAAHSVGY